MNIGKFFKSATTLPGSADRRQGTSLMQQVTPYAQQMAQGGISDAMRAYLNEAGAQGQIDFQQLANLLRQQYKQMGLGNSSFAGNALSQLANNAGQAMTQARVGILPWMEQNQRYGNELMNQLGQEQFQRGQEATQATLGGLSSLLGTAANLYGGGMFRSPAPQVTGQLPGASSSTPLRNAFPTSLNRDPNRFGSPTILGGRPRVGLGY